MGSVLSIRYKGAAMRVQNADRALDDQPVKFGGANPLGKRLSQAMKEIEDAILLDLKISTLAFQLAYAPREGIQHHQKGHEGAEKQRKEDVCPHGDASGRTLVIRRPFRIRHVQLMPHVIQGRP